MLFVLLLQCLNIKLMRSYKLEIHEILIVLWGLFIGSVIFWMVRQHIKIQEIRFQDQNIFRVSIEHIKNSCKYVFYNGYGFVFHVSNRVSIALIHFEPIFSTTGRYYFSKYFLLRFKVEWVPLKNSWRRACYK